MRRNSKTKETSPEKEEGEEELTRSLSEDHADKKMANYILSTSGASIATAIMRKAGHRRAKSGGGSDNKKVS